MTESKILVIYIGVAGIRSEDISDYVNKIYKTICPPTFSGSIVVIPIQELNTRIECINPKYITNEELIKEHTELMTNLQKELKFQLEQLKENNKIKQNKKKKNENK